MKIVIDCDKLMEREDLRKFLRRKKGMKREKTRRKEKREYEKFS